jgi:transposase
MSQSEYSLLVGIDWASEKHDACVLDGHGEILAERTIEHTGEALSAFLDWLVGLADDQPKRIAVAMEINRGALVDAFVDRGIAVYSINPKQLDRFRDRHTVAGAKDDRLDAYVAADALRTDRALFRRVSVDDVMIIELREFSRMRDDLIEERTRLANRLHNQLHRFFPQMLGLCSAANEPWFWALVEAVPTPEAARNAKRTRITKLLEEFRIRRYSAEDVLRAVQTKPLTVAKGTTEAACAHIGFLLPRLRLVDSQLKQTNAHLATLLEKIGTEPAGEDQEQSPGQNPEHRDVDIILSVPGIGITIAATMLAEASVALKERDYATLRTYAGVAPVTRRSGKRIVVTRRYACNPRLGQAMYHAARVHCQRDPSARAHYAELRRKHDHGRALRGVADRMLNVLIAMLRTNTTWDPDKRQHRVTPGQEG